MTKSRNLADLAAFTATGAGAVQRTVEAKLRDIINFAI